MALKRHASALKQPDHREKKARGGEEEDTWSSTLAALKTAPREKPPAIIDGLCPLSTALGALVRAGLAYQGGWDGGTWAGGWGSPRAALALLVQEWPQLPLQTPLHSHWESSAPSPIPKCCPGASPGHATRCRSMKTMTAP